MNKNSVLSVLVLVVVALLIGMVLGYTMHNEPDASAATVERIAVYRTMPVMDDVRVQVVPIVIVRNVCSVVRRPVHVRMHTDRTTVLDNNDQEDSNNGDDSTVTVTPTPVITNTLEPAPTQMPTSTPVPTKQNCNNGVGNGPDCPPPGHDKDNDGVSDDSKGNNDDDGSVLPCGDPGNPCNKKANQGFVIPLFVLDALINACIAYKNKHYARNDNSKGIVCNPLLDHMYKPLWAIIKRSGNGMWDIEYQIVAYTEGCDPLYGYESWDLVAQGFLTFDAASANIPS